MKKILAPFTKEQVKNLNEFQTNGRFHEFTCCSPENISECERINKTSEGSIRISRNDLASVAGIATETFIRTLSGLKKDGLIDIEGRNIRIIDLDKLKSVI